jgi:hypothetical protein
MLQKRCKLFESNFRDAKSNAALKLKLTLYQVSSCLFVSLYLSLSLSLSLFLSLSIYYFLYHFFVKVEFLLLNRPFSVKEA